MSNEIRVFDHEEFGTIRTIVLNEEPWFVAADVCRALDVSNPTDALKRLDDDEKARLNLGLRGGETNCVNEPGLYSLVLGSRKPETRAFKRWVTHEVIPTIRKHGAYMTPETIETVLSDPDTIIRLATELKEARQERDELANKIALDAPKVVFSDSVSASETSILVYELAKLIKQNGVDIGGKRLFEWLRENGFLCKRNGSDYNMPTQKSMEMGLFEIKETTINHSDGHITVNKTPKITGKGQIYFVNKFLGGAT